MTDNLGAAPPLSTTPELTAEENAEILAICEDHRHTWYGSVERAFIAGKSRAAARIQELSTQHQIALRTFYELFGRLGLTMINECTLEQCLVSGKHEIDSLQAAESELRKLRAELKEQK